MIWMFLLGLAVAFLLYWLWKEELLLGFIQTAFLFSLIIFGVKSCVDSEWYQASEREKAAEQAREAQPHVIREADGCKVYAFKSGDRYHYFTKCGLTTTTESSYSVSCGKNCSKTEVETIVMESKK